LAEGILIAASVPIFFGVALSVLRLVLGPTVIDRVAAIDMLTVVSISLIALYAHVAGPLRLSGCRSGLWCSELSRGPRNRPLSRTRSVMATRDLFVYLLCGSIILSGILAIRLDSTLAAAVSGGLVSLFASVCYVLLGAPDVAMAEASIGSGLSVLIFLYAIHRTTEKAQ
jgi:energy-converting hydrogenase B subunit D